MEQTEGHGDRELRRELTNVCDPGPVSARGRTQIVPIHSSTYDALEVIVLNCEEPQIIPKACRSGHSGRRSLAIRSRPVPNVAEVIVDESDRPRHLRQRK